MTDERNAADALGDAIDEIHRLEAELAELRALKAKVSDIDGDDVRSANIAASRYGMLDVWLALGGNVNDFEEWMSDPKRTDADAWAQLLAAIRGDPMEGDHNPEPGLILELVRADTGGPTTAEQDVIDAAVRWWYNPQGDLNDPFAIDAGEVEADTGDLLFSAVHAWMGVNPERTAEILVAVDRLAATQSEDG